MSYVLARVGCSAEESNQPAIVFAKEAIVTSEPNNTGAKTFELHEGTKVQMLENLSGWVKISLSDGQTGWIQESDIKALKDW